MLENYDKHPPMFPGARAGASHSRAAEDGARDPRPEGGDQLQVILLRACAAADTDQEAAAAGALSAITASLFVAAPRSARLDGRIPHSTNRLLLPRLPHVLRLLLPLLLLLWLLLL